MLLKRLKTYFGCKLNVILEALALAVFMNSFIERYPSAMSFKWFSIMISSYALLRVAYALTKKITNIIYNKLPSSLAFIGIIVDCAIMILLVQSLSSDKLPLCIEMLLILNGFRCIKKLLKYARSTNAVIEP